MEEDRKAASTTRLQHDATISSRRKHGGTAREYQSKRGKVSRIPVA
jgi:hypothetical protein